MFYLILVVAVAIGSAAQLLIKAEMNTLVPILPGADLRVQGMLVLSRPMFYVAGGMLVLSASLWYFSVGHLPLSRAYLFSALSYPMVLGGSAFFLGESLGISQFLGCALIMLGIIALTFG